MGSIFMMTFSQILRPKRVIPYLLISCGVTAVTALLAPNLANDAILQGDIISFNSYFAKLAFLWLGGLPLVFWLIGHGLSLLALEKKAGTLLLLASKPISRSSLVLSKYLALNLAAFLLGECSLLLALAVIILAFWPDPVVISQLLTAAFFLGFYLLFLSLCISAFALSASLLCKSRKVPALVFSVVTILVYGGMPLMRMAIGSHFRQLLPLFYFDLNLHLSSVFHGILSLSPGITLSPHIPEELAAGYLAALPGFSPLADPAFSLGSPLIGLIWLVVSLAVLAISLRHFKQIDIME
jgi:ABC-type transport system involved in multi-copper enzyme maturation permease subunit